MFFGRFYLDPLDIFNRRIFRCFFKTPFKMTPPDGEPESELTD
jgi:hypothetical protein